MMSENAFEEYTREVKDALLCGHTIGVLPGTKFYTVEAGWKEDEENKWTLQETIYFSDKENARKYILKEVYRKLCYPLVRESLNPSVLESIRLADPEKFEALSNPIMQQVIEDFRLQGGSELRNCFLLEAFDWTMEWLEFAQLNDCYTFGSWMFRIQSYCVEKEIPQFGYSNRTLNNTYHAVAGINEIIEDKINRLNSLGIHLDSQEGVLVAQALGCELEAVPGSSIFQVKQELYPMPAWGKLSDSPSGAYEVSGPYFSTHAEADSRAILDSIERLIVNECDTPWGMKFPSTDEEDLTEEGLAREVSAIREANLKGTSYLKSQREAWAKAMREWVQSHNYSKLKPFIIEHPRISEKLYTLRNIIEHRISEPVVLTEDSLKEVESIARSEVSSGEVFVDDRALLKAYTFISVLATA